MNHFEILINMGAKIKSTRIKRNITQSKLADLCNTEKASMSRIESGKTNLTILTLHKISTALGTDIAELLK
jgi:transcriptional regulator with XRE-family HTH domain